jgi:hypothetical protein
MLSSSFRYLRAGQPRRLLSIQDMSTASTTEPVWCTLVGFSPFVNRLDLQIVLDHFQPLQIEPLVEKSILANGSYALKLSSQAELNSLTAHLAQRYSNKYVLQPGSNNIRWASNMGISNKTVKLSGLFDKSLRKVHIAYLLENYRIAKVVDENTMNLSLLPFEEKLDIRRVQHIPSARGTQYLITLETSDEAERLVTEMNQVNIEGMVLCFTHFPM